MAVSKKSPAKRRKAAKAPSCLLCSAPVDAKSTSFTVGKSRPLVHACERHAPVIRSGVASAAKLAAAGVRTLVEIRYPGLLGALRHFSAAARAANPQD